MGSARRGRHPRPRGDRPDDLPGLIAARGVLTSRGGRTSHAAVVARGLGRTCVCGADELQVDEAARLVHVGDIELGEGDLVSLDGSTGEVFVGAVPVVDSPVVRWLGGRTRRGRPRLGRRLLSTTRTSAAGSTSAPTPTRPPTLPARAGSAPRESGSAAPSTCSSVRDEPWSSVWCSRTASRSAPSARSDAAATAQRLRGHPDRHGRAAGHRPAARPSPARVPARPHRPVGARGRGRGPGHPGAPRFTSSGRRSAVARAEPDAGAARRQAGTRGPGPVRDAGARPPPRCRRPPGQRRHPGRADGPLLASHHELELVQAAWSRCGSRSRPDAAGKSGAPSAP